MEQFCKNCETQLHSSEPDVIQDIHPHFIRVSFLRRVLLLEGGSKASPFYPQRLNKKFLVSAQLANEAVLKDYVRYKGCQFETNTDNQSNMTATANLMQAQGIEATQWLSKDNIPIELTLSDFLNIGGLILNYKTNLWTNIYAGLEAQIEAAKNIEDVENIVINYGNQEG